MSVDKVLIDLAENRVADGNTLKTVSLPGPADDLSATVALVESGLFDDYVTYQGQGVRRFAGNTRASIVLDQRLRLHHSSTRTEPIEPGERPLRQLGKAVGQMLRPGQRAYGFLTFELARPGEKHTALQTPLAHFMTPELEVCWSAEGTDISSYDEALLDAVVQILDASPSYVPQSATPVDLHPVGQRARYEQRVATTIDAIQQGKLSKAIISRRIEVPFAVDLTRSYALGLQHNTPARSFLLQLGDQRCAGFSPEILAMVTASGETITQPLAGTRPLRNDPVEDLRLRKELEWDVKECYEHVISVRQSAEELRTVCSSESVVVRDLLTVKQRGTVQHLGSAVVGQLDTGNDAWDALDALFPAVTASGIAKDQALSVISTTELDPREMYGGAVCVIDDSGALDSAVVLRSIYQRRNGTTWLRAGAGIVADSIPSREYEETTNKLRSVSHFLVRAPKNEEGNDDQRQ